MRHTHAHTRRERERQEELAVFATLSPLLFSSPSDAKRTEGEHDAYITRTLRDDFHPSYEVLHIYISKHNLNVV